MAQSLLAAGAVALVPLLPGAHSLLRVGVADTGLVAAVFAGVTLTAAIVHRLQGLSRTYWLVNDLETSLGAAGCLFLVYASGTAISLFWVFYLLPGAFGASAGTLTRPRELAVFVIGPVTLAGAFGWGRGSLADAATALLVGGCVLWLLALLARAARRLQAAMAEQRQLEAQVRQLLVQEERARIARDLHDGLGAELTSLLWQARELEEGVTDEGARERLRELSARLRAGIDELRGIVAAIPSAPRRWAELASELERRCAAVCRQATFRFEAVGGAPDEVVPGPLAGELVRMALEAVRNADRHAEAQNVSLRLEGGPRLQLTLEDDGRGIEPEALALSDGGLRNLRTRAARLGGALSLEPLRPGTRVVLSLPLRQA